MHDVVLRDVADQRTQRLGIARQLLAVVPDLAGVGGTQADQGVEQRGLARAGRTQDAHELSPLNPQAEILQDRQGADSFAQMGSLHRDAVHVGCPLQSASVEPEEERADLKLVADDEAVGLEPTTVDERTGAAA